MFKKISPKKISDEIVEQFKDMLSKGELKPGEQLPSERVLAQQIGVSRPPLREALNALQAMGFIEIKPRRKIIIRSLVEKYLEDPLTQVIGDDIQKVFELLEIRRAMESWAAYKAAQRATNEDIEKLELIIEKDQENLKNNRDEAKNDADFHVAISMATKNTIQSHLMAAWYDLLWKTQKMSREKIFRKRENRQIIAAQHLQIFKSIKARNGEKASQEVKRHIDFVEKELKSLYKEETTTH
jgi:GntR family transcriptional repressor for pyruvate dehydrogenase complex